jgi:plasmid stability protein
MISGDNMAAMTIRKISDQAAINMKLQAKANGRSVEAEARLALETAFAAQKSLPSVADVIEDWKMRNGGGLNLPSVQRSRDPIEPADFE